MIYDEVGEIVRRYGKKGYKIIADNECLREFFRRSGDWTMYCEDSCGGNCVSWEKHGDTVYLEHDYFGGKAKIKSNTLKEVIALLNKLNTI